MENTDRKALAFAALQRFWTLNEPDSAEQQWQKAFAFGALPEQLAPGSWCRYEGQSGFIEYKATGDGGQFYAKLPEGVDPASVVVIRRLQGVPSIYDRMRELLLEAAGGQAAVLLGDLDELKSDGHARRVKFEISGGGLKSFIEGRDVVSAFLSGYLEKQSVEGLNGSKITGFEVASVMLLDSLMRQLTVASPEPPPNLMGKMFDAAGVPSLPEMTARFICDCCRAGMNETVNAAIDAIRKGGDGTLAAARAMQMGDMHPGLYLDRYYNGLQQAGVRFLAVRWGCLSALTFGGLEAAGRGLHDKRAASAVEKFVRIGSALLYAIQDLDGTRYRQKQQALREAKAEGDEKKASALLFNLFQSQMFYPTAVEEMLCKGV